MKENTQTKIEYITEKYLDKRFEEQTKIILEAVDFSLRKHSERIDARFDSVDARFDSVNARFDSVDARFDELETELKSDISSVQTLIDGYVKAQEDFKQEFVIMKEEIKLMKQVFKEKLGVEIRAF